MLKVDNISLYYGAAQALRGVTVAAEPGKVTCVLGRNGVGKTSLLRAMVGQQPISGGEILFEGQDIKALKPYERARRGISFVPQGREIFPLLTVEENLRTGFAPLKRDDRNIPDDVFFDGGKVDLTHLDETQIAELGIGRKFQKPTVFESQTVEDNLLLALNVDHRVRGTLFWREAPDETEQIERVLETIRLKDAREKMAGGLSHGQKQWLEIGMLLAQDPKLLLVDEPVAGMTDVETHQTAELLKEINKKKSIVVVEHDMTFVRELGVKVTCLHEGSVLAEGTIDQVSQNDRVVEVYLGR